MPSAFSRPPMRCSSPAVPGIAHGRARVCSSRRYGQNSGSSPEPWLRAWRTPGRWSRQLVELGDPPRLGAVGQHAVGEQHHRRPVGDRDPDRLQRGVEAVARRLRRDDRHRRLAVAAEHRLEQVGLLGLGRQPGRRAAALHVDDEQRELGHHREADGLRLQRDAGTGGRRHAEPAGERRARGPRRCPAISSSAWKVVTPNDLCLLSSWRMSEAGVIGYEPRNSGSPDRTADATRP